DPLLEYRRDGGVLFEVDTTKPPTAVINVEVARNLLLIGFQLYRAGGFAQPLRQLHLVRSRGQRHVSEVLFHVSSRAEFTLFLARPQSDANGPARLYLESIQNP